MLLNVENSNARTNQNIQKLHWVFLDIKKLSLSLELSETNLFFRSKEAFIKHMFRLLPPIIITFLSTFYRVSIVYLSVSWNRYIGFYYVLNSQINILMYYVVKYFLYTTFNRKKHDKSTPSALILKLMLFYYYCGINCISQLICFIEKW